MVRPDKARRGKKAPIDYAVVGAGVSGAYVAWRLAQAFPKATIQLFEATHRVGGRLLTAKMPGMPFNAELGGMRYTNRHIFLRYVIKKLRLDTHKFSFDPVLLFLRGSYCGDTETPPYELSLGERGRGPGALLKQAIYCALREITFAAELPLKREMADIRRRILGTTEKKVSISTLTARQWEIVKRYGELHGSRLFDIGFWNLLQYYLSSEGFLFAHDGLGYESIVGNWNAAEAIPWFLRDFEVEYRSVNHGMQHVAGSLAKGFDLLRARSTFFGHCLHSVRRSPRDAKLLKLTFKGRDRDPVYAKHVILALPQLALLRLKFALGPRRAFDVAASSVTAQPLFKLFLGYERSWWDDHRGIGRSSGKAVTDLPIRQVYYWGPDKARSTTTKAMLMASYSDAHYIDFWRPLHRSLEDQSAYYRGEPLDADEAPVLGAYGVTDTMARKAHRQIVQLHPHLLHSGAIPDPLVAIVKEWSDGWYSWNVHTRPWVVMRGARRPFNDQVYICGEAYSPEQGWIEGALRSAEAVLKSLEVPAPDVRRKDYRDEQYAGYEEYVGTWAGLTDT